MPACKREVEETQTSPALSAALNTIGINLPDFTSVSVWNGMLYFQSQEHLNAVVDQLVALDEAIQDMAANRNQSQGNVQPGNGGGQPLDKMQIVYNPQGAFDGKNPTTGMNLPPIQSINQYWMDDEPALYLFELGKNFVSLRQYLTNQSQMLMDNGTFDPDSNNPDDFYIIDEFTQVLLNPGLEIRVGNSIYKSLSATCMIEITNSDMATVNQFREMYPQDIQWAKRKEFPTPGVVLGLPVVVGQGNIQVHQTQDPVDVESCTPGFTFVVSPTAYYEYHFTNTSVVTGAASYVWNFGDGSTSTQQDPIHIYQTDGTYQVQLLVYENGSFCSFETKTITVANRSCNANFTFTTTPIGEVTFANTSTVASGDFITGYKWKFGDTGVSTLENPLHTYSYGGTFWVCLEITTNQGCVSEYCEDVLVALECCKARDASNKHLSLAGYYRVRSWLSMVNIPWAVRKVIAKSKSYLWQNNRWKNAKSDMIQAQLSGEVFSRDCGFTYDRDPELITEVNENVARAVWSQFSGAIRAKLLSISSDHFGLRNNTTAQGTLSVISPNDCD